MIIWKINIENLISFFSLSFCFFHYSDLIFKKKLIKLFVFELNDFKLYYFHLNIICNNYSSYQQ